MNFRHETVSFGEFEVRVRTLHDLQEFRDDDGEAEALGISSASWPIFGVVWRSGRALAQLMVDHDVAGRRVLEVGCGIGLASLVLNHRGADITATDYHPEAGRFLAANVELNGGRPIPFARADWADEAPSGLGTFDLVIGSDLLYEDEHAALLAGFIDRHTRPACEVIIIDSARGYAGRFSKCMLALGYSYTHERTSTLESEGEPYRGKIMRFVRPPG
ncbi:MAG: methyltransferase domain-containing protein [Myxococcota bacterium]